VRPGPDKKLAAPPRRRHKARVAALDRLQHYYRRYRHADARTLVSAVYNRLWPARPGLAPAVRATVLDRTGLEIGGPSGVFQGRGILPAYPHAARIDNVNFAGITAWESDLRDGGEFHFDTRRPPGRQFLREATDLHGVPDNSYDFLLSSHCLEHVANPLAALREWRRVVRPGGALVLILPDPRRTFDHRRPVTTLAHLQADFDRHTGEDDLTHLEEILALHDLIRDVPAGMAEQFRARSLRNAENRCLHHHVFDSALQRATLEASGWAVEATECVRPLHLVALARRPAGGEKPSPAGFGP
jgi:SAM-dependent methyltransferase